MLVIGFGYYFYGLYKDINEFKMDVVSYLENKGYNYELV